MTKKALPLRQDGEVTGCYVWCQGCKHTHFFPTNILYYTRIEQRTGKTLSKKPVWTFNGNYERPTFTPSLRQYYTHPETKQEITTCHNIITDGKIQFCDDCPHEFKGQTLELEVIPESYGLPDGVER